jgi:ABC-type multidrug transport system ATPase subunit
LFHAFVRYPFGTAGGGSGFACGDDYGTVRDPGGGDGGGAEQTGEDDVMHRNRLKIKNLTIGYSSATPLARDLCAMAEQGRLVALLGRNGTGKSCLMRILFDELRPTHKSIRVDGVWQKRLTAAQVLYLPQQCSIPDYYRVERVFADFGVAYSEFVVAFPGLLFGPKSRIGVLSGGEKRLVELFVILRADSQFVMLDEPFSQVMPLYVDTIKELILNEKQRKGILVTDHLYRNVLDITDDLFVLHDGMVYKTKGEEDLIRYGYIK